MENGINAWEKVQLARDKERPYAADYIEEICDEVHGTARRSAVWG